MIGQLHPDILNGNVVALVKLNALHGIGSLCVVSDAYVLDYDVVLAITIDTWRGIGGGNVHVLDYLPVFRHTDWPRSSESWTFL